MSKKEIPNNYHKERHYSNTGGHKKRSEHWNGMRRLYSITESIPVEIAWIVKRAMLRDPRSGK